MAVGGILCISNQMPNYRLIFCLPQNNTTPYHGPIFFWGYIFYLSKILKFIHSLYHPQQRRKTVDVSQCVPAVQHAVSMVMCYVWLQTARSLFPAGLVTNSCVHILMYTYYILCSFGRRPAWKRLVTDCQISQFVLGYVMSMGMLWLHFDKKNGSCSGFWSWVLNFVVNSSLLGLSFVHLKIYAKMKPQ